MSMSIQGFVFTLCAYAGSAMGAAHFAGTSFPL